MGTSPSIEQRLKDRPKRRELNHMWHIEDNRLIKTSNGEPLPDDEPVFVFRGRDRLAIRALELYRELATQDGCNDYMLNRIDTDMKKFLEFRDKHPKRMKQPGVTRGR